MPKKAPKKPVRSSAEKKPIRAKRPISRKKREKKDGLEPTPRAKMRIIGIGGGGGNIVSEISFAVQKVDFMAANTDTQALKGNSKKVRTFAFGQELTGGLGAGMDAELAERAAKEEMERIVNLFEGYDVCVFVASLGGGTGSGAAPVFAEAARRAKCLTVGIFTMPFHFEGEKRSQIALSALEKIRPLLNAYVVIPNEKIFEVIDKNTSLSSALSVVNKRLADSLEGLIETIYLPGLINVDFADLRSILEGRGRLGYLNSAQASGEQKAREGSQRVLASRWGEYGIEGADRILFNITSDRSLRMEEVAEISRAIGESNPRARIIFGISFRPDFKKRIRITLFAVGCRVEKTEGDSIKKKVPVRKNRKITESAQRKEKPAEVPKKESEGEKPVPAPEKQKQRKRPSKESNVSVTIRRNALDLKKEVDEELKSIEEEEHKWDIPAFLRSKPRQ